MTGMLLLATGAVVMRGWTLKRIDAQQDAYQAGDSDAMRHLRMVHWGGMAANILAAVAVGSSVPHIL